MCDYVVLKDCFRTMLAHFEDDENVMVAKLRSSSHHAVVKMCQLEFRFQNIPFSKCTVKNVLRLV